MGREKRGRHHERQDKNNRRNSHRGANKETKTAKPVFHRTAFSDPEDVKKHIETLEAFKTRIVRCAKCGKPITELASALTDTASGEPIHFDCALEEIKTCEQLKENERISYIGQGKFAVLHFENPRDTRRFTIVRTIEWEPKENRSDWRVEMSGLYSQVL